MFSFQDQLGLLQGAEVRDLVLGELSTNGRKWTIQEFTTTLNRVGYDDRVGVMKKYVKVRDRALTSDEAAKLVGLISYDDRWELIQFLWPHTERTKVVATAFINTLGHEGRQEAISWFNERASQEEKKPPAVKKPAPVSAPTPTAVEDFILEVTKPVELVLPPLDKDGPKVEGEPKEPCLVCFERASTTSRKGTEPPVPAYMSREFRPKDVKPPIWSSSDPAQSCDEFGMQED